MPDHSLAVMAAVRNALLADATVAGFVDRRVWDDVPETGQQIQFPYLTFGDGPMVPTFYQDIEVDDAEVIVHIWSRAANQTSTECRQLRAAVIAALHNAALDLGDDANLARLVRGASDVFRDPDNKTWHGVARFAADIESLKSQGGDYP